MRRTIIIKSDKSIIRLRLEIINECVVGVVFAKVISNC